MTILFAGRNFVDQADRVHKSFREELLRCLTTHVDKRHIVYDYAVSRDNIIFVPLQDENAWNGDHDWSGSARLELFSADYTNEKKSPFSILQSVWHLYPDGTVQAQPSWDYKQGERRRLPAHTLHQRFGLPVGAEDDTVPADGVMMRYNSLSGVPPPRISPTLDIYQQARTQYFSPHRRGMSDPFPSRNTTPDPLMRHASLQYNVTGSPPAPLPELPYGAVPPEPGAFAPSHPGWDRPSSFGPSPYDSVTPPPGRRISKSQRRRTPPPLEPTVRRRGSGRAPARKLSRSQSHGRLAKTQHPPESPQFAAYDRRYNDKVEDPGCGCTIM